MSRNEYGGIPDSMGGIIATMVLWIAVERFGVKLFIPDYDPYTVPWGIHLLILAGCGAVAYPIGAALQERILSALFLLLLSIGVDLKDPSRPAQTDLGQRQGQEGAAGSRATIRHTCVAQYCEKCGSDHCTCQGCRPQPAGTAKPIRIPVCGEIDGNDIIVSQGALRIRSLKSQQSVYRDVMPDDVRLAYDRTHQDFYLRIEAGTYVQFKLGPESGITADSALATFASAHPAKVFTFENLELSRYPKFWGCLSFIAILGILMLSLPGGCILYTEGYKHTSIIEDLLMGLVLVAPCLLFALFFFLSVRSQRKDRAKLNPWLERELVQKIKSDSVHDTVPMDIEQGPPAVP